MMMMGVDPYRDSISSDFSDCSDIVGTPGAIPFTWEEQPGRPKGPAEKLFESIILSRNASRRDVGDSMIRESITTSQRAPASENVEHTTASDVGSNSDASSSDNDEVDSGRGLSSRMMNLNLRASLMGVHILDDETEMFFSRQVSNASSNTVNYSSNPAVPTYRSGGAIPFKWELEPGIPLEGVNSWASEPRVQVPLTPPPGSRAVSGILYPYPGQFGSKPVSGTLFSGQFSIGPGSSTGALYSGQLDLGPDIVPHHENLTEKLFKKLVGQSRATVTTTPTALTPTAESPGHVSMFTTRSRRLDKSSTETLDRQFGHYNSDFCYESVSPTSTLDHQDVDSESSVSSASEGLYPSRHRTLTAFLNGKSNSPLAVRRRPSPCLLSLTAVATVDEISTDEDDIIFEQPNTAAPLLLEHVPISPHLHNDWSIVPYTTTTSTRPGHRHPKSTNSDPTRTFERWSSSSSSWNLSLGSSSKGPKLILCTTGAVVGGRNQRGKPERRAAGASNGSAPNFVQDLFTREAAMPSTILAYDKSGDTNGNHKWEIRGDSSGSLRSADELGFEPYDRPEDQQMADTVLDEEDFPFSPIASSFVFGERNSVEVSKRSAGRGIPKAVGPIVQQFTSTPSPQFDHIHEYPSDSGLSEGGGSCSDERSLTYSLEDGAMQLEQEWIPTKSFHYIKGQGVEIVELGCSGRVFSGYIEINHSGRFDIDLETGPGIQRQSARTPEVLIRLVKDATKLGHKKKSGSKYGCFSQCKCLSMPKKGFLSRCLTSSNQRPRLAVPNSFQSRLGTLSSASVDEKAPTGPFQFF